MPKPIKRIQKEQIDSYLKDKKEMDPADEFLERVREKLDNPEKNDTQKVLAKVNFTLYEISKEVDGKTLLYVSSYDKETAEYKVKWLESSLNGMVSETELDDPTQFSSLSDLIFDYDKIKEKEPDSKLIVIKKHITAEDTTRTVITQEEIDKAIEDNKTPYDFNQLKDKYEDVGARKSFKQKDIQKENPHLSSRKRSNDFLREQEYNTDDGDIVEDPSLKVIEKMEDDTKE